MRKQLVFVLLMISLNSMAQWNISGEYYFRRHELVAGFNFSPDGKFQFFYSYGAVDRNSKGSFLIEGDSLKLKAEKEPGKDFKITTQARQGKGYRIRFEHPNKYLLKHITCLFLTGAEQVEAQSDANGDVQVELADCDTIYVQHDLFPDIATLVKDKQNDNNFFTLSLQPSLEQVSFLGIQFKIQSDSSITCLPNYLLPMERIEFIRE